eukprot:364516-Chlamydomonas_euryale.AAC.15
MRALAAGPRGPTLHPPHLLSPSSLVPLPPSLAGTARLGCAGGCDVVSVAPGDEAAEMRMALSDTWERPHKSLQYWLDHHHGSYAHDLRMAAAAALRAAIRAEQLAAGAPVRGAR